MVERVNSAVKKRETFRPFAPTVLAERAGEVFEDGAPSPWMSRTVRAAATWRDRIPAVVHVDGTARPQTLAPADEPLFRALVEAFEARTGLPLVLNTSFNVRGEPLVESPADALRVFLAGDLDLLVLEDRAVRRRPFPPPEEHAERVPVPHSGYRAEVVTDADGDVVGVTLSAHGDTFEADALQLAVLESCDGGAALASLASELRDELEVTADELLEVFRVLYRRRLLSFASHA
jgi:hypothetical protein